MTSYQYRKFHCGDKMILRPSFLHNAISYTDKMSSLYWIRAQNYSTAIALSLGYGKEITYSQIMDVMTHPCLNLTRWGQDKWPLFRRQHFKCIVLNEYVWSLNKISLKFVPKDLINNIPALVQIMAWRWLGDKPLSEPMMFCLLTHICVTQPQWVKYLFS